MDILRLFEMLPVIDILYISDITILNTFEWTRNLDKIWRKNKEEDEGLAWQYIGTQTGVMRIYPGQSSHFIFGHHFFLVFILMFTCRVIVMHPSLLTYLRRIIILSSFVIILN